MKTWLIALVAVIAAGCTGGVQNSESSDTSFLVSTSSAATVVPTTVVKTTVPQTTTSQAPTSTIPGCEIFVDSICPSNGVDPRLACLPNCDGVDFTGMVAPGLDFSAYSFEGANFTDAILIGSGGQYTNFQDAVFAGADLSKSNFNGICFPEKMRQVNFDEATFYKVEFCGSDLRGATFIDAGLLAACFIRSDLTGVDFTGAGTITEETYEGMGFYGVGFYGTTIIDVRPSMNFGPTKEDASQSVPDGFEGCF
ncbi:MAG: pentapeptide repeat-containing protein [Actinomycetes bacterium]